MRLVQERHAAVGQYVVRLTDTRYRKDDFHERRCDR
jgi:hypothetical protein